MTYSKVTIAVGEDVVDGAEGYDHTNANSGREGSTNGPLTGAAATCGRVVASCGIVIAVACSGTPRDIAKCCSGAFKKRDEIEVQVCNARSAPERQGEPPTPPQNNAFDEFVQRAGSAVGTAAVVVIGGVIWILTGGQWTPSSF